MEKAKVYFTSFRTPGEMSITDKLKKLLRRAGMDQIDFEGKFVAIKLHFGELGNLSYLRPAYARAVADEVKRLGGKPFLVDCNTLYPGSRKNALDHLECAAINGFNPTTTGCQLSLAFSRNPLHPPPLLKRLLPTNQQNARLTLSYNSADILPALPQAPGVPPLSHRLSPLPEAGARLPHHAHPTSHWIPANIHPPSTHPFAFLPQVLPQDFKGTNTTLSPFAQNHHHHKAQRTNRPKNQPKENKQTNTALSPVSWSSPDTLTALPQARGVPQHSLLLSPLPHQASGAPPPSTLPPLTPSPPLPAIFPQLFQGTLSTLCPFSKTLLPGSCQLQLHWQPDLSPTAPASVPQQSLPLSSLPHARTPTPTTQARRAPPPSTLPALTPSPPPFPDLFPLVAPRTLSHPPPLRQKLHTRRLTCQLRSADSLTALPLAGAWGPSAYPSALASAPRAQHPRTQRTQRTQCTPRRRHPQEAPRPPRPAQQSPLHTHVHPPTHPQSGHLALALEKDPHHPLPLLQKKKKKNHKRTKPKNPHAVSCQLQLP